MKKIMVYAYTKFNLGDDLFIKILCERYPKTRFIMYAPKNYKQLFSNLNNLTIYPSDSLFNRGINFILKKVLKITNFTRKKLAKKCDAAVLIGGSLFIENYNWEKELENKKGMLIKNKPFFLLGANFGPFHSEEFYYKYKDVFKSYEDLCFREKFSYDMFNDLTNVRYADDVIFSLKEKEDLHQVEESIVISVIKPSIRKHLESYDEIYYEKIRDISIYFIDKGYKVSLMSFCEKEGDKEAIANILKLIPLEYQMNLSTHLYDLNLNKTIKLIASSQFIVATRFHAMILGWLYNKPVFPIVYSEKMTNVMTDIGFEGNFINFDNMHKLSPEKVFKSIKENPVDVTKQIKNSELQFEKLDKFLNSN